MVKERKNPKLFQYPLRLLGTILTRLLLKETINVWYGGKMVVILTIK